MPGIGIITNPHSRRNRRNPEQMRRLGYILGQDDAVELTNRIEDIEDVARQFMESDIDILALNGGDGTNHITLTRFIKVYGDHPLPRIALLRGGTMNTVSNGVGIHGTPPRLLANLVDKYYTGGVFETTERDILCVRTETHTTYGFIFGNGIVANFLKAYYDSGNPSPSTAAIMLARAVSQIPRGGPLVDELIRPFRARITFEDGQQWPDQDFLSIVASTQDQLGLGFRPFIRSEERQGAFHLLGAHGPPLELVKWLPRIRLGLPISPEVMLGEVASRVVFEADEPFPYTVDGDMYVAERGEVELCAGPRLTLILK